MARLILMGISPAPAAALQQFLSPPVPKQGDPWRQELVERCDENDRTFRQFQSRNDNTCETTFVCRVRILATLCATKTPLHQGLGDTNELVGNKWFLKKRSKIKHMNLRLWYIQIRWLFLVVSDAVRITSHTSSYNHSESRKTFLPPQSATDTSAAEKLCNLGHCSCAAASLRHARHCLGTELSLLGMCYRML